MAKKFKKLFEPLKIKNVTLKNRMVKSSQWFIYPEEGGLVGERIKQFYATIAKGGVGLVIVEESCCEYPLGASNIPHIRLDDDKYLPGLSELADAIHQHDCPAFVQITHAGPAHKSVDGQQPIAPSTIDPPPEPAMELAREMTIEEVREKIELYSQAALRVKKAGFEGCEVHLAHYAMGNSFLSRIQNKRTDEYGCESLENRARFGCEILRRTHELVGPDFVVGVRISAVEYGHPLGTTNEEAVEFAKMFEAAGADYIQSSAYGYNEWFVCWAPDQMVYPEVPANGKEFVKRIPQGALLKYAAEIKKAVSIPVSGVGRLDCDNGEKALKEGIVDMVWLGRRLMVDPAYPNKVKEGRFDDIRPCIGCMNCLSHLFTNTPVQCRWNGFMGREYELGDGIDFPQVEKKKKVMVVGAGPGGMEAARVAALRGHEVTLYDKESSLGGQLPLATFIKGSEFDDLSNAYKWYEYQLKKNSNVTLSLGKEVTPELVAEVNPDAVILSPGSSSALPDIPGIDRSIVVSTGQLKDKAKNYLKYLSSGMMSKLSKIYLPVGKRVIVVGGDLKGLEAAEFLIKRGKQVTIVEDSGQLGQGMNLWIQFKFFPWMEANPNITAFVGVTFNEITDKGMIITTSEGEKRTLEADTVMVIEQDRKNHDLYKAIKDKGTEVHLIGDAKEDENAWLEGTISDAVKIGMTV
jgi:2,4-dienoyl-CoA reductase-like NADH-dependent reductase (Old Yellow Enzyme family)/thioredoxin reductase